MKLKVEIAEKKQFRVEENQSKEREKKRSSKKERESELVIGRYRE